MKTLYRLEFAFCAMGFVALLLLSRLWPHREKETKTTGYTGENEMWV
ncbi:hypothetical protein [Larkinella terrae]|uniref:Uncharacterized protein n=1 Tax=Larkinella terrae TaxID=2025311 RepID=A0A7K0EIV8_9BACT|nr:hypothetical protein [Larkinella terrae]MRS61747.1 hypothetical protein [Larkinella terrae]